MSKITSDIPATKAEVICFGKRAHNLSIYYLYCYIFGSSGFGNRFIGAGEVRESYMEGLPRARTAVAKFSLGISDLLRTLWRVL